MHYTARFTYNVAAKLADLYDEAIVSEQENSVAKSVQKIRHMQKYSLLPDSAVYCLKYRTSNMPPGRNGTLPVL